MNIYKFDTLNDEEFEELSKDLLYVDLGIDFKTFRKGKDGGIDLSYVSMDEKLFIGQAKHYPKSTYSNLKNSLQKEFEKIKNKNVEKYILITSLDLSVSEVKEIIKIMKGIIKSENDVYDLKRLNTILQRKGSEWIEKKYYKLWLSSTNILGRIIKNAQENNIEYYVKEIDNKIKLYVVTENIHIALEKLNKNNMLLIHGEPGVGKTVLAEMIAYNYLSKEYKLRFISGNKIEELEDIMSVDDMEKEIIFIDDFLGENYLSLFTSSSESKLIFFLNKYLRKKNKFVVLTTRSTIYNKAKQVYEKLDRFSIEFEKYNLTLNSYNQFEKARILYNHLCFNDLDREYIEEIRSNETYLKIIEHRNYTPRLIEFITNKTRVSEIEVSRYPEFVLKNLNNPEEIWRKEFETKILDEDRFLVWTIFTFEGSVRLDILEEAFHERYDYEIKNSNIILVQNAFNKSIESLLRGFIKINRTDENKENCLIGFINPSVNDFLINYLNEDSKERKRILNSIKYIEQLQRINFDEGYNYRVNIDKIDREIIKQKVIMDYEKICCIKNDKKLSILKLIEKGYKNDQSIKSTISKLLEQLILANQIDKEKLEVMMSLVINRNISLDEIGLLYEKNQIKGDIRDIILDKVVYMETFLKFLLMIRICFTQKDNIDFLSKMNHKVYQICRQTLADFANDLSIKMDDLFEGYYDENDELCFDWDEAEKTIEWGFGNLKFDILNHESLLGLNYDKIIEENLNDVYYFEYGEGSGDKLIYAIEELWNLHCNDNYEEISNLTLNEDYNHRKKISEMFRNM